MTNQEIKNLIAKETTKKLKNEIELLTNIVWNYKNRKQFLDYSINAILKEMMSELEFYPENIIFNYTFHATKDGSFKMKFDFLANNNEYFDYLSPTIHTEDDWDKFESWLGDLLSMFQLVIPF